MSEKLDYGLRLLVSGTQPGTGSSSLTSSLAEDFDIKRYYGGEIRRRLANSWNSLVSASQEDEQVLWDAFTKVHTQSFEDTLRRINKFKADSYDDEILRKFNEAEKRLGKEEHAFEEIPDYYMKKHFNNKACVLDGKLACLIDAMVHPQNQEMNVLLRDNPSLAHPIIRILLTVNPEEGARRTFLRKVHRNPNSESMEDAQIVASMQKDNERRIKRDWERYSETYEYQPTGEPVSALTFNYLDNLFVINTSEYSQVGVHVAALMHIQETYENHRDTVSAKSKIYLSATDVVKKADYKVRELKQKIHL